MKGYSMLILTRLIGETIMIGDDTAVTILGLTGYSACVGINAPKEAVHREEIYERIWHVHGQGKAANDVG